MRRAALRLGNSAHRSQLFSSIGLETDKTIQRDFKFFDAELREFIHSESKKGYGRWLWKPFLINRYLERLPENDILFYVDSGCHLNIETASAIKKFNEYLDTTCENKVFAMQQFPNLGGNGDLYEKNYNSIDLKKRLKLTDKDFNTCQIQATFSFFSKSNRAVDFATSWLALCRENNHQYLRESEIKEVSPAFIEYRWDQSIFSGLMKSRGEFFQTDESWWAPNWVESGKNYPIWAMRHRSGANPTAPTFASIPDRFLTKFNI